MYSIWWGYVMQGIRPYAAKITGFDPVYTFKREFVRGYWDYSHASKRTGKRIYFPLEPNSIYDCFENEQGKRHWRGFILTNNQGDWQEITKEQVIEWLKKNSTEINITSESVS